MKKAAVFYLDEDGVARLAKVFFNGRCHLSADLRQDTNPEGRNAIDIVLSRITVLDGCATNQHLLETSEELVGHGVFKKKQVIAKAEIGHYGLYNCISLKGETISSLKFDK